MRRAAALALAALVAGCGTGDGPIPRPAARPSNGAPAQSTAPSVESPATTVPSAAPGVAGGAGTCEPGFWSTIKTHIDNPAVALVGLVDGCRAARIETTLDPSSAPVAVAICNRAAELAWPAGIGAITVLAADGRVIATGLGGERCTGGS